MSTPQDRAFDALLSQFPKRYGVKTTQYLRGLLKALAEGDGYIESQIEAARDNLIAVTARGRFLDRAAGRYGIVRGQGAGLLDEEFQRLIPLMGMSPKQISHILLEMIDTFYGPFASHANVTSGAAEPFALQDGFSLRVFVDNQSLEIAFTSSDAANLASAKADEVATAISQKTKGTLIGSVVTDTRTGNKFVNIRTKTIGARGFVQVLGGDAQTALQFPEVRPVSGTSATWSVTRYQGTDEMVYTVTAGAIPDMKAAGVVRKDFVTIRSDSGFDLANTGTYEVTFVGPDYFRLKNGSGVAEAGVTQAHLDDFVFFRPDMGNVLLSSRPAALLETSPRELTVLLPVTSPIVRRTLKGGHHLHGGLSTASSTTSNSVTVGSSNGFPLAGALRIAHSRKTSKGTVSSVVGTNVTLISAQNWPTKGAFYSPNQDQYYYFSGRSGNILQNVSPTPPSALAGSPISYSERYRYTSITGNTLNGVFPDPTDILGAEVVSAGASTTVGYEGSFLFDPTGTFTAAEQTAKIQQSIVQGSVTTLVQVDDVTSWPDKGYFVLEFGTGKQEGPIRYLSKIGTTGLIVDPSHVYDQDHFKGISIRLVRSIGVFSPAADGTDLPVFMTSTSPARDLLASYLRIIAASGVKLRFEIRVPEDKWTVLPNRYTTNPLDTELVTV
jgi:hypothetical protein